MEERTRFRPHERIRSNDDFRRAFERKRSASDDVLIIYAAENGLNHARLGISVGRRKVRKAHDRNRFKRLVREAFRLSKRDLPEGVDFVVVPRGPILAFDRARDAVPKLAQAAARRLGRPPYRLPEPRVQPQAAAPTTNARPGSLP